MGLMMLTWCLRSRITARDAGRGTRDAENHG